MSRIAWLVGLTACLVALGGCAAGAPDSGLPASTETVIQIATETPPIPVASPASTPPPTIPQPTSTTPAGEASVASPAPGDDADQPIVTGQDPVSAPTPRPAPPPDPGQAVTVTGEGTNDRLQIALTFDAGADRGYGEAILDFLRDEGISATFGMTGRWAEDHPDLVARMASEGHHLVNHSYTHESFNGNSTGGAPKSAGAIMDELRLTEEIVREITGGYEMRPYFRFPYGDWDEPSLAAIHRAGYYLNVYWTCDSWGWKTFITAGDVVWRCTTEPLPHEITLLHVGAGAAADFEALPGLVEFYRGQGYEFVTVEEMLQP